MPAATSGRSPPAVRSRSTALPIPPPRAWSSWPMSTAPSGRKTTATCGGARPSQTPPGSRPPTPTPTPTPTPSPNDTVVKGTAGSITDARGNKWTITAGGQVAVNGVADTTTKGVVELAYVNGTIWQENNSNLWWGETKPNASWAPTMGTATSPLPAVPTPTPTPTPAPTPSVNDSVVKAGSTAA